MDTPVFLGPSGDGSGLLGLPFHPGFAANGRFFVHYSGESFRTVLSEFCRPEHGTRALFDLRFDTPLKAATCCAGTAAATRQASTSSA